MMGFDVVSRRRHQSSVSLNELPYLYDSARCALLEGMGKERIHVYNPNDFQSSASPQEALESSPDGYVHSRQVSLPIILTSTILEPHPRSASASRTKSNTFGSVDEAGEQEQSSSNLDVLGRHSFLDPVSSVRYTPFGTPNLPPHSSVKKRPKHLTVAPALETSRRLSFVGPLPSPSWPYTRPGDEGDKRENSPEADMKGENQDFPRSRVKSELFDTWNVSWNLDNGEEIPRENQPLLSNGAAALRSGEAASKTEVARQAVTTTKTASLAFNAEKGHLRTASEQPLLQTSSCSRRRPHINPRLQQRSQTMYVLDNQLPQPRLMMSAQFLQSIPAQSPYPLTPENVNYAPSMPQYHRNSSWGPIQYMPSDLWNYYSVYNPVGRPPLDLRRAQTTEPRLAFSASSFESELYHLPSGPQPQPPRLPHPPITNDSVSRTYHVHPDHYSHQDIHRELLRTRSASLSLAPLPVDNPYGQRAPRGPDIRATRHFIEFSSSDDRPRSTFQSLIMPSPLQGQGHPQRLRTRSFHQPPSRTPLGQDPPPPMPATPGKMLLPRVRASTLVSPNGGGPLKQRKSGFFAKVLKKKSH